MPCLPPAHRISASNTIWCALDWRWETRLLGSSHSEAESAPNAMATLCLLGTCWRIRRVCTVNADHFFLDNALMQGKMQWLCVLMSDFKRTGVTSHWSKWPIRPFCQAYPYHFRYYQFLCICIFHYACSEFADAYTWFALNTSTPPASFVTYPDYLQALGWMESLSLCYPESCMSSAVIDRRCICVCVCVSVCVCLHVCAGVCVMDWRCHWPALSLHSVALKLSAFKRVREQVARDVI